MINFPSPSCRPRTPARARFRDGLLFDGAENDGNSSMDIAEWLRGLNLSRYEAAFRDNEIDWDVLPDLTDFDLERLGVPMGHRKRLLRAIAKLGAAPVEAPPPSRATPRPWVARGERRQLTLMFCDLVGSTALAARLDPEDMAELIHEFQGAVSTAIAKFDGLVAKWLGDGALIYFGYPRAHEDDAERAVRAGLALAPAVRVLRNAYAMPLEIRVGIATGLVVVGELTGEGEARERGVVGETPNLAARLQGVAEPGQVVVSESTRRLLGGTFELEALAPQAIRGLPSRGAGKSGARRDPSRSLTTPPLELSLRQRSRPRDSLLQDLDSLGLGPLRRSRASGRAGAGRGGRTSTCADRRFLQILLLRRPPLRLRRLRGLRKALR
jgi:class 3 adenylate cyclase